jgi:hypothetical protein
MVQLEKQESYAAGFGATKNLEQCSEKHKLQSNEIYHAGECRIIIAWPTV